MSTNIADGGPAFPKGRDMYDTGESQRGPSGMSLRDYFAAKALVRLIEDHSYQPDKDGVRAVYLPDSDGNEDQHDKFVSTRAYEIADAMLAARSKQ